MSEEYQDLGLPLGWEGIALALSPAPLSDWHVVPPVISPRLQTAINLLDERSRVILVLWSDGEAAPSIGEALHVEGDHVLKVLYHSAVRLLGATALLRRECSEWLRDHGIDGSAIVRFADERLDLGDWGPVPESTAWRLLLSLFRRQGGPHRLVALHGDRHLIVDHVKHRIAVVEPWLRDHGDFADVSAVTRATAVPGKLLTHGIDAFRGAVSTKGGLFYSKHLSSIELTRATARRIAVHGAREWHFSHLANLLRHAHPGRFHARSIRYFADLVNRLPRTEFEPSDQAGWWRLVGDASSPREEVAPEPGHPPRSGAPSSPARASRSPTNDTEDPSVQDEQLSGAVVSTLREANEPLTIHELAARTGDRTRNVHRAIFRELHPRGVVVCTDGRRWALATSDDGPG